MKLNRQDELKVKLLYSKWRIALWRLTSIGRKKNQKWSFVFRGLNQSMKGENKFPGANKKSSCVSLSLLPKVKAKVLRHSTIGQNNILCSAHHIPMQAKCLWIYIFFNFKAFWLKYTRRALTEQSVSVLLRKVSMAAVHSLNLFTSRLEWNKHDRWFFKKIKGEVLGTHPSK